MSRRTCDKIFIENVNVPVPIVSVLISHKLGGRDNALHVKCSLDSGGKQ